MHFGVVIDQEVLVTEMLSSIIFYASKIIYFVVRKFDATNPSQMLQVHF
jgi:hypothetical protein